jgi:MerR family mercuric resistance operon transcriptional regulator
VHIGEAARQAGVSVDTVRFYQRLGLISTPRSTGGYRLFSGEQIRDLTFVRHAQELGFSLTEIKELLTLRQKQHLCPEVQTVLERKLKDVRDKIRSLSHIEEELGNALGDCKRELRNSKVKHDDSCPLIDKLEHLNGSNEKRRVVSARRSTQSRATAVGPMKVRRRG